MSDEVDTRVSPAFDPGNIAAIEDYDEDTRPLLGQAETAVSEVFEALKGIHDAKAGAAKNPTINDHARLLLVDDYARARMAKVFPRWDRARDTLDSNIAQFEQELRAPVEQSAPRGMGSEIRSYFRGMEKETQRWQALREAINEGDEVTVSAVLGGKPYLSGIDAETSAQFLQQWHERSQPKKAKQLRAMKHVRDIINDREPMIRKAVADAVGYIDEYKLSNDGKRQIHARRITPAEVRVQRDAANKPFAVGV